MLEPLGRKSSGRSAPWAAATHAFPRPGRDTLHTAPSTKQPSETSGSERDFILLLLLHFRGKKCACITVQQCTLLPQPLKPIQDEMIHSSEKAAPCPPSPSSLGSGGQLCLLNIQLGKQLWEAVYLPARLMLLALMSHISS